MRTGSRPLTFVRTATELRTSIADLSFPPDAPARRRFWLPRTGISDPSLPVTQIERIVGTMTMRTVGTVERMLAGFAD